MIRDLDKQLKVKHHCLAKRDRCSIAWPWYLIIASLWGCLAGTLQAGVVNHVIHVSVDGLHAGHLFNLIYSKPQVYDNFKRFVDEGTTTFNARTDVTHTTTLPNHTSTITGRPVSQFNEDNTLHHGYTHNGWAKSTWTLHDNGNPNVDYIASTFDVAHDYGLSTSLFANKTKFVIYEQSYNATESTPGGREDQYLENGDQGTDKIDRSYTVGGSDSINMLDEYVIEMQANPYNYTLLHFVEPDAYGHGFGWGTPIWNASVSLVDHHLGILFDLVENNSTLNGNTAIVLTSDHGGEGFGHSSISDPDNFTVPFFVWGAGATPGSDLYALNPFTRASPGVSRPLYSDSLQPIRNGGSGNLALSLLSLPANEGSLINAAQDLVINFPETANWNGDDPNVGSPGDGQNWNDANNWSRQGISDKPFHVGDRVTFRTGSSPSMIDLEGNRLVTSLVFEDDYRLSGGTLTVNSGDIQVNETVVATIDTDLVSPSPFFFKTGLGTLQIDGTVGSMYLVEGVLGGNGVVSGTLENYHIVSPGSSAGVHTATAVPEPSGLLLLVLAAGCMAAVRGRSYRS